MGFRGKGRLNYYYQLFGYWCIIYNIILQSNQFYFKKDKNVNVVVKISKMFYAQN